MLDWDEANNLPDAATWLLETRKCYRGCQKGLEQTDWGVSPQEPKFHKIPNWRRLDHRRPTAVHTVQWWLWHQKRWPGLYPSNTPCRYNPMRPAEPRHHTQKISIVPLRITYADDPCIVLYLLPLLLPKSPPNSRERFGFSQKSYMNTKKVKKATHLSYRYWTDTMRQSFGYRALLGGSVSIWKSWGHQIQTLVGWIQPFSQ